MGWQVNIRDVVTKVEIITDLVYSIVIGESEWDQMFVNFVLNVEQKQLRLKLPPRTLCPTSWTHHDYWRRIIGLWIRSISQSLLFTMKTFNIQKRYSNVKLILTFARIGWSITTTYDRTKCRILAKVNTYQYFCFYKYFVYLFSTYLFIF